MLVGLVGCGRWGVHVLRDLRALGCDVHVAVRSDRSSARAREGGASAVVRDVSDLSGVDGIVVTTPTSTHAEVVEAALAHGVPIFVEKPLCADAAQAAGLAAVAGDRLFVMDKWRYHPGVVELAAIARTERLGHVRGLVTTRVGWGTVHDDVDCVWVLAPHDLSIALEILGRVPEPVSAVGLTSGDEICHLEATLDAAGVWHTLTVSSRSSERRRRVDLMCSEGTASLAGGWDTHVLVTRAGAAEGGGEHVETPGELPLLAELRAFVEHLAGGPPPKSNAREGAEVVAAIERLRGLVLSS
jgi:predicted dehydrogenase